ncbi:MAG: type IX secretion system sortase PorU, partial [Cyclobacteriaceae bacterium]|nr:type IX secretion system sortase PorU [Cyclobacteriaceae bacterium]
MQTRIVFIFLLFPFFAFSQVIPASSSAFAKGDWIKMGVVEEGIYKITYADLVQQGINVGSVRPSELKVFGIDWGDLPQNNDSGFSFDPLELAVHIEGENDGIFNEQDYILFYARGPHKFELTSNASVFELGYNHYSDTAYYFLNINSGSASKRVLTQANSWDGLNLLTSYDAGFYYKSEQNSRIMSGRDWYGEYYSASAKSRLYQMPNWVLANNSTVKLAVSLLGYTFEPALFTFKLGGFTLGNLDMSPVIDYRYADKGIIERDTFAIASTLLPPAPQLIIDFSANAGSRISEGYMEHLIYQAERPLITVDTQTKFSSLNSLKSAISSYQITLDKPLTDIWDVTDLQNPASQLFSIQSGKVNFGSESSRLHSFIAFDRNSNNLLKPLSFETVINQNLKDQSPVDLIIITPELFSPQAEELAAFRRQNDGFDVQVTSINEIYNEFSGGRRDPSAIRNYVRYMYWRDDSPQKLKYVLLFGKGTFDAKNIMGYNNNFIPVYESRNSLNPLNSYGSDDFYAFLDANEGYWEEYAGNEPDMDVAIGRLPVKNQTEAAALVSKIIHYSSSKQTLGSWRNEVLFVADDGDFNIHQSQSNQMAMYVDTTFSGMHPKRLFLDNFIQEPRTGGEKSPDMEKALSRYIEEGSLIVNFTGHGGPGGWMQEGILDNSDINNWTNINKLPLFVTATCEFGRHDNPTRISGGELIILKEDGGGIGLVTTSRPVFSTTNFILNKAFYAEVFGKQNNSYKPLGEVFRQTKNNSMNGVFNRNFSLLGDPSMTLNYPEHEVKVKSINSVQPDLIDLQGLSSVTVAGNIVDFSGQL